MNMFINTQVEIVLPHFRLAVRCEAQMRDTVPEAERSGNTQGAKCHPHREATLKPNTEPLSSERNPLLLSANSGHKFEMTSWELHFVVSMLSEITSPTSARPKLNSSSNWMALPSVAALGAGRIRQRTNKIFGVAGLSCHPLLE